jgi:purine-nucleoside phosphorylase
MSSYERATESSSWLQERIPAAPDAAIVLGSGLGGFAARLESPLSIPYADVPHWTVPRVAGHPGRLVAGRVRGKNVLALCGRIHRYEGHRIEEVVFATRVLGLLGVPVLVLTNAAGGVNPGFAAGALMLIDDHLNLLGENPLTGPNDDRFGPRFPDMTAVYSGRLRTAAEEAAKRAGVSLAHGVYAAVHGPSYETPAEIRALRVIGADAVGMSTVPEAITARHMGIEVLGISCITNMAAGILPVPLDHREVIETAHRVRGSFIALLEETIERI